MLGARGGAGAQGAWRRAGLWMKAGLLVTEYGLEAGLMTGVGSPRRGDAGAPQAWGRRAGLVGAGFEAAEPGEGRGERQKAGPDREALKSREPRLQGEVRVCVAKKGRALGRRRELLEGRDSSSPPWASWAVALSAGGGERCDFTAGHHGRGGSPPRVHTRPPHTFGGPAVRCEQASNEGREGGRALER